MAEDTRDGIKLTLQVCHRPIHSAITHLLALAIKGAIIGVQQAGCCVQATANPVIKGVVVRGANVLPQKEIEEAFQHQFGRTLNFPQFSGALKKLNKWYEDRGIFGQARTSACGCILI